RGSLAGRVAPGAGWDREARAAGRLEQRAQLPARLRLTAVPVPRAQMNVDEAVDPRIARKVGHRAPVDFPRRDDAPRLHHPQHFAKREATLAQVLEDLMGVGDVERALGEGKLVDAPLLVAEILESAGGAGPPRAGGEGGRARPPSRRTDARPDRA